MRRLTLILLAAVLVAGCGNDKTEVPDVTPQLNWKRLRQLALTGPGTGRAAPQDG